MKFTKKAMSFILGKKFTSAIIYKASLYRGKLLASIPIEHATPNAIVAGVLRAGTTSLHYHLSQHPCIMTGKRKEVMYYYKLKYINSFKFYKTFFPRQSAVNKNEKINGKTCVLESSPSYLFHSQVPKLILSDMPDVKLIFLLRNPIDRAISHYYHNCYYKKETLSLMDALKNEACRIGDFDDEPNLFIRNDNPSYWRYSYIRRGLYYHYLINYCNMFNRKNIYIDFSENLLTDPTTVLNNIYDFLNLKKMHTNNKYLLLNSRRNKKNNHQDEIAYLQEIFDPWNDKLAKFLNIRLPW